MGQDPVDRLKQQGFIVDILDLTQGEAGRMILHLESAFIFYRHTMADIEDDLDSSDDDTPATNFYVDNFFAAVDGTIIEGPNSVKVIPGDINEDEVVDIFDLILARKGVINGLTGTALKAADVNGDGDLTVADLVQLSEFIMGKRDAFTKAESVNSIKSTVAGVVSNVSLSMKELTTKLECDLAE